MIIEQQWTIQWSLYRHDFSARLKQSDFHWLIYYYPTIIQLLSNYYPRLLSETIPTISHLNSMDPMEIPRKGAIRTQSPGRPSPLLPGWRPRGGTKSEAKGQTGVQN